MDRGTFWQEHYALQVAEHKFKFADKNAGQKAYIQAKNCCKQALKILCKLYTFTLNLI